jgi:hypothetical protein
MDDTTRSLSYDDDSLASFNRRGLSQFRFSSDSDRVASFDRTSLTHLSVDNETTRRLSNDKDNDSITSFDHRSLSQISVGEDTMFLDEVSKIIANNKMVYERDISNIGKSFDAHVAILKDNLRFQESKNRAAAQEIARLRAVIAGKAALASSEMLQSNRMSTISERAEERGLDSLNPNLIRRVRKDVWLRELRQLAKRRKAVDLHHEDSTVCEVFGVSIDRQADHKTTVGLQETSWSVDAPIQS